MLFIFSGILKYEHSSVTFTTDRYKSILDRGRNDQLFHKCMTHLLKRQDFSVTSQLPGVTRVSELK